MYIPRNRTRWIIYGGIVATSLMGVLWVWTSGSRHVSESADSTTLHKKPSAAAASPLGVPMPAQEAAQVDILGRDLKTVTSKIGQLEAQLALLSRGNDTGAQPHTATPKPTTREIPLGQASLDQTAPLERFRHFQVVMQSEREDPRATTLLQAAFRTAAADFEIPPESSITDISCRETMCKVSASHSGQAALDQFLRYFPATVPWDMTAEIQYEPLSNGASQTVVFVSMQNKTLPEM